MLKNSFSFPDLNNEIDKISGINNDGRINGTFYYTNKKNSISVSLESFYGEKCDYVPSGTSKLCFNTSYITNVENKILSNNVEIAFHGFDMIPYTIKELHNNKEDISFDEFLDKMSAMGWTIEKPYYDNDTTITYLLPVSNKNHRFSLTIHTDDGYPCYVSTHYSKSGSASWYNMFNARIYNETFIDYGKSSIYISGIRLSNMFNIIVELYNHVAVNGVVPVRPLKKQSTNLFGINEC